MPEVLFYVGSCTRKLGYVAAPTGKGIACFRLDIESGEAAHLGVTEGIDNPTFVDVSPDGRTLIATSEVEGWNEGTISGYGINPTNGALEYLSKQPTLGDVTAHCSHDNSGRFVASANYSGLPITAKPNRSLAVYPRSSEGTLSAPVSHATHHGTGPNKQRQERPHAHCARWTPDNRFLIVTDLGLDRLIVYGFDNQTGGLSPHGEVVMPAGSGPRHFRFHPTLPFVYCANELDCTLTTLSFDAEAGTLSIVSVEPTLPNANLPADSCSAIAIPKGGRHIFVGIRGDDSVARFEIDQTSGSTRFIGTTPCGGHVPRDFAFDPTGQILAVANQESDRINLFRYDHSDGGLSPLGAPIATGSPTGISFHPDVR
ncbi:lactonase family protein [Devosia rhodophyticola]|uniref:Lactonase family protein n=1 Tax=Devosia rhodophyticola TaxID=3026423 RepID=A0ABY7YT38_9HYPH|nr:lactonase family protein [Devosia rhodophyticola]WDR04505.1 lactonase family protein [Devosia rhodophyticola]